MAEPKQDPKDKAIADLSSALEEATAKLKQQDAVLKSMSDLPGMVARISHNLPDGRIIVDGQILIDHPDHLLKKKINLKRGDYVHVAKTKPTGEGEPTYGIVARLDVPPQPAIVTTITEVMEDGRAFFGIGDNLIPIKDLNGSKVEAGDRVLLGGDGPMDSIVIENLGKPENTYRFTDELTITWDDIGGQTAAKAAMREAIEFPIMYAELYAKMGKKPLKGVVLEGPPGCGKTMLGKAAAHAIRQLHGKAACNTGYIYVKGPEVLSKWVGEAEATIRKLFKMAAKHKKDHGYPAIIFIDECEALLSRRGTGVSSDMEKTIVPSFLAEMDGMNESGALVILATNRAERLDPAVVRDGRIDRRIRVTRPSKDDCAAIFAMYLRRVPSCKQPLSLASQATDFIFKAEHKLYYISPGKDQPLIAFNLAHCVSGAMIAGIVDRATSIALHAAIASGHEKVEPISHEHLEMAIRQIHGEMYNVDHTDDMRALAEANGGTLHAVSRA